MYLSAVEMARMSGLRCCVQSKVEVQPDVKEDLLALDTSRSSPDNAPPVSLAHFTHGKFCSHDSGQLPPPPQCVKSIALAAHNPPRSSRKLRGDLIYLDVLTADGRTFHVTGSVNGFFVNKSTAETFDPTEMEHAGHAFTLSGLLSQISPLFKKQFGRLLLWRLNQDAFESIPVTFPTTPWVGKPDHDTFDENAGEDAVMMTYAVHAPLAACTLRDGSALATHGRLRNGPCTGVAQARPCRYGLDLRGLLRDWNEEYQATIAAQHSCRVLRTRPAGSESRTLTFTPHD